MGLHHHFDVIGDQIASRQDIVHPVMALGNSITRGNNAELYRCPAGLPDSLLHILRNLV